MTTRQEIFWGILGLLVVAGIIAGAIFGGSGKAERPGREHFMLVLDYGNGDIRRFQGELETDQAKAWDLLQQVSAFAGVSVKTDSAFTPYAIGETTNHGSKKWVLYINGVKQAHGPLDVGVSRGDVVTFKYE